MGTMVTAAAAMLFLGVPEALFPELLSGGPAELTAFLVFFCSVALLLLPFDLIGGLWTCG